MVSGGVLFDLFVSHVEAEGSFLKVWGQKDRDSAVQVERLIRLQVEAFEKGFHTPDPRTLHTGLVCCALYTKDESYYRAKILDVNAIKGEVLCLFLDYGNKDYVLFSNLRSIGNDHCQLSTIPAQAESYILSGVVGNWDSPGLLSKVTETLSYEDVKGMLLKCFGPQNEVKLLRLYNKTGEDYLQELQSYGVNLITQESFELMAMNAFCHAVNLTTASNPYYPSVMNSWPMWQQRMLGSGSNMMPYLGNPMMAHPLSSPNALAMMTMPPAAIPPALTPGTALPMSSQGASAPVDMRQKPCARFSPIQMDEGSEYSVFISYVENGSFDFAVQLASTNSELEKLSLALKDKKFTSLRPPFMPGLICLAKFSEDDALYRAAITNVESDKCSVYFVDYGNSESVKCHDLFEIPDALLSPKPMAVPCTLSGRSSLNSTDEMKKVFYDLIFEKDVTLIAVAPDCKQLQPKQAVKLFINDDPVEELIKLEMLKKRSKTKLVFRNVPLPEAGSKLKVVGAFVKSFDNFYVQLATNQNELESMMTVVAEHCNGSAEKMVERDISDGVVCCALFSGDNQWYRAMVINADLDDLTVMYVDYGNEEKVSLENLRHANDNIVNKLRAQALPCKLSGFNDNQSEDLAKFEELILGERLVMHVIQLNEKAPYVVVKLFNDNGNDVTKQLGSVVDNSASTLSGQNECRTDAEDQGRHRKDQPGGSFKGPVQGSSFSKGAPPEVSFSKGPRQEGSFSRGSHQEISACRKLQDEGSFRGEQIKASSYQREPRNEVNCHKKSPEAWGIGVKSGKRSEGHCDRTEEVYGKSNGFNCRDSSKDESPRPVSSRNQDTETWDDSAPTLTIESLVVERGVKKPISIAFSSNPCDFYVHERPMDSGFDSLMEQIEDHYSNGGEPLSARERRVGGACVAKYSEDGVFYRAKILELDSDGAVVFFVDYGNKDKVAFEDLKKLIPTVATLKSQAVHCKLLGVSESHWSDVKIHEFESLLERESLEAEFIESDDNGLYSIIIRDSEPNDGQSINELFGATASSLLSPKSIVTSVQPRPVLPNGAVHDVMVTWFQTPSRFYVQLKSSTNDFKRAMTQLQKDYKSKSSTLNPSIGHAVVAIFKSDMAFYRGVIRIQKGEKYGVEYMDYGNRSLVEPSHIYGLEHQYSTIPAQAILCSLDGVLPFDGKDWTKSPDIAKYFQGDLKLKVVQDSEIGAPCMVRLSSNGGQDLSEKLVEEGFGISSSPAPISFQARQEPLEVASVPSESAEALSPSEYPQMSVVDLQLLVGQLVPAHLSFCPSPGDKMQLKIAFDENCLSLLQNEIANMSVKDFVQLPSTNVVVGQKCLILTEACEYRRAVIVDGKATAGVVVEFMDICGVEECPSSKIFVLPQNLEMMPPVLYNLTVTNIQFEDLKKLVDSHEKVVVAVESCDYDRVIGQLLDARGQPLPISIKPGPVLENRILPMPILHQRIAVNVVHASGSTVWMQQVSQADQVSGILEEMYRMYEEDVSDPLEPIVAGCLCAAKSLEDENWYRAIVVDCSSDDVSVEYIDYGNTETLPPSNLKVLKSFLDIPALAVKASLPLSTEDDLGSVILELANEKSFTAVFVLVDKEWRVELMEGEEEMSKMLVNLGKAQAMEINSLSAAIAQTLYVGSHSQAKLSFVKSPDEFYVHLQCNSDKLSKIQDDLQILSEVMKPLDAFPEVGSKVLALYPEDETWYRGQVVQHKSIFFIDYGNDEVLDLKCLKTLPPAMEQVPSLATKCCLEIPSKKCWSEKATEKLNEYLDCGDFIVSVKSVLMDKFVVDISIATLGSVSQLLLKDGLMEDESEGKEHAEVIVTSIVSPGDFRVSFKNGGKIDHCALYLPSIFSVWSSAATSYFKDLVADGATVFEMETLLPGEPKVVSLSVDGRKIDQEVIGLCNQKTWQKVPVEATVVWVNSPGDFYIHLKRDTDAVEEMTSHLEKASEFDSCPSDVGTVCAALFTDDDAWYRAIILNEESGSFNVKFIDYGNTAISPVIKELPHHLQQIPPLALHCALPHPNESAEWSPAACEMFQELVDDQSEFEVELLSSEEPYVASLTRADRIVAHELAMVSGIDESIVDGLTAALRNSMQTSPKGNIDEVIIMDMDSSDNLGQHINATLGQNSTTDHLADCLLIDLPISPASSDFLPESSRSDEMLDVDTTLPVEVAELDSIASCVDESINEESIIRNGISCLQEVTNLSAAVESCGSLDESVVEGSSAINDCEDEEVVVDLVHRMCTDTAPISSTDLDVDCKFEDQHSAVEICDLVSESTACTEAAVSNDISHVGEVVDLCDSSSSCGGLDESSQEVTVAFDDSIIDITDDLEIPVITINDTPLKNFDEQAIVSCQSEVETVPQQSTSAGLVDDEPESTFACSEVENKNNLGTSDSRPCDVVPDANVSGVSTNPVSSEEYNSNVAVSLFTYLNDKSCELDIDGTYHGRCVASASDFEIESRHVGTRMYRFEDCEHHANTVIDVYTTSET